MKQTFKFGFLYFLIIFLIGFVLGVLRNIFLLPIIGPLFAVLIEVPFILLTSYFVAKKLLRLFPLSSRKSLEAGLLAFACLMCAEYSIYVILVANDFTKYINEILTPHGFVGFFAQMIFALIPYLLSEETKI